MYKIKYLSVIIKAAITRLVFECQSQSYDGRNTIRPKQNGQHFAVFKWIIFLYGNFCILIKIYW